MNHSFIFMNEESRSVRSTGATWSLKQESKVWTKQLENSAVKPTVARFTWDWPTWGSEMTTNYFLISG